MSERRRSYVLIRTAPRDGADYLPELVAQVEAEGHYGVILADAEEPRRFDGWTCLATGQRLGGRLAGWCALQIAAATDRDALILEDDVVPVPGGVGRMLACQVPHHLAFVSFFDIRIASGAPGLREEPCSEFMQAQAIKVPARTARALAGLDPTGIIREGFNRLHAFDLCLGLLASDHVSPYYGLLYPNLVDHRGDVSAVEPGRRWSLRSGWLGGL
jgi:hypothetical protein